ncbi:MAG: NADPH-dependent FMN reductase [Candidatus Tokpelaia hoelldobleri]|uniref:NADPH-dependent FMN reductase n=1 Tax=Candidatus Tokpelaia hoelldobleri TaxID=1902579 RepID=A0A1U9JTJ2_9HYPH|nr:MAG: NADPH-dependent FMN reductase [Candidatus Tokpelaia hoelldoblerii]
MTKKYKIAVIVGSLRQAAYSRKAAHAFADVAPADLELHIVEIGDLPLYNEDLETDNPPAAWVRFRKELKQADGFLFITPEYNRSVPGVLKNAIDVGSRPYGKSVWGGKPGAVISVSMGGIGGFGANHHLRQTLVFNDVLTMQQPEVYLGTVQNLLTEDGKAADDNTRKFFTSVMSAFEAWVKKIAG